MIRRPPPATSGSPLIAGLLAGLVGTLTVDVAASTVMDLEGPSGPDTTARQRVGTAPHFGWGTGRGVLRTA